MPPETAETPPGPALPVRWRREGELWVASLGGTWNASLRRVGPRAWSARARCSAALIAVEAPAAAAGSLARAKAWVDAFGPLYDAVADEGEFAVRRVFPETRDPAAFPGRTFPPPPPPLPPRDPVPWRRDGGAWAADLPDGWRAELLPVYKREVWRARLHHARCTVEGPNYTEMTLARNQAWVEAVAPALALLAGPAGAVLDPPPR